MHLPNFFSSFPIALLKHGGIKYVPQSIKLTFVRLVKVVFECRSGSSLHLVDSANKTNSHDNCGSLRPKLWLLCSVLQAQKTVISQLHPDSTEHAAPLSSSDATTGADGGHSRQRSYFPPGAPCRVSEATQRRDALLRGENAPLLFLMEAA